MTTTRTMSTRSWVSSPLTQLEQAATIIEARLADGTSKNEDYDRDVLVDLRIEIANRRRDIARGQEPDMVLARALHRRAPSQLREVS